MGGCASFSARVETLFTATVERLRGASKVKEYVDFIKISSSDAMYPVVEFSRRGAQSELSRFDFSVNDKLTLCMIKITALS